MLWSRLGKNYPRPSALKYYIQTTQLIFYKLEFKLLDDEVKKPISTIRQFTINLPIPAQQKLLSHFFYETGQIVSIYVFLSSLLF